jgi:hypothetical protein
MGDIPRKSVKPFEKIEVLWENRVQIGKIMEKHCSDLSGNGISCPRHGEKGWIGMRKQEILDDNTGKSDLYQSGKRKVNTYPDKI